MPPAYREQRLQRHQEMKEVRAIEEPHWRDIAWLLRPDDRDFDAHLQRRRDDTAIFDSSPLYALDDFVGGFFSQATNPENRWFELETPDLDLNKWQPVKAWLWRRTNQMLASFTPAVSPFYAEVPDWYAQIGAFGWSAMYSAERVGEGRITDRAIPIGEAFMDTDADGEVNEFDREFSLTGRQAKRKFAGAPAIADLKDTSRYVFVHAVWPNDDYRPGKIGLKGMKYCSCYVSPDVKDFYVGALAGLEEGYYEFPYAPPRWKRRSGRVYPTGPGHTARADISMVNEMARSNLVAAQFAAEPPLLVHEKADVIAADIEPNAILYGTMNAENGKKLMDTLQRAQNLPVSLQMQEATRNNIRTAFRWGIMQLIAQRPQMTATEFLGFQEEDLKLMGPGLVRVQNEGLTNLIARRWRILDRAGAFDHDPPPPELAGQPLAVHYVSPLAKMMKVSEAKGALSWVNALLPYAQVRPEILDNVDGDNLAIVVHDGFTSDPSLITDPRKRDQARADRAAAQQSQLQMAAAEQAANIHATVSHAQQASTLAKQRTQ
jgi:Bacteriophage head to tail connecting protein